MRVINEDKVQPGTGFGFHPHKNMEIITFMLDCKIQHKDNMGNVGNLSKGNAQLMRVISSSEMNPFNETAHLLQIWINSDENNLKPVWWEKEFTGTSRKAPSFRTGISGFLQTLVCNIYHMIKIVNKSGK